VNNNSSVPEEARPPPPPPTPREQEGIAGTATLDPRWRFRLAARFSVFLPFAAFMMSCVYQQLFLPADLEAKARREGWMQNEGYYLSSFVVAIGFLVGLVLSIYALWGALRQGDKSTIAVATMGFLLNLGAVGITAVAVAIVMSRAAG
jgi:uncharacterized membrane protein YkgB